MNPATIKPFMSQEMHIKNLRSEWEDHLVAHGHRVGIAKGIGDVLESRDPAGNRYRWLFLVAKGRSRTVNQFERADIECHMKRAQALNQKLYVAVSFGKPKCKVVVLPGETVLRRGLIVSSRGGIPWDR